MLGKADFSKSENPLERSRLPSLSLGLTAWRETRFLVILLEADTNENKLSNHFVWFPIMHAGKN